MTDNPPEELVELLADVEHERWSGWMRYMLDNFTTENMARWRKQMVTPYADLPEHSKESDRKEVRKTLAAIAASGTHVVVPVEPTMSQKTAGQFHLLALVPTPSGRIPKIYKAMIAAAQEREDG